MPEILRSLIVVLVIAYGIFFASNRYASVYRIDVKALSLRTKAWYAITLAAFLSNNFWIFCTITAIVLFHAGKKDKNPLALVCFVLFAVPLFGTQIPGFGIVNYLFEINYFRMISLTVLLPAYLILRKNKSIFFGHYGADKFIIGFLAYQIMLMYSSSSLTNLLRVIFTNFLDIFLPYYVASRLLKTIEQFEDVMQSLVIASAIVAAIGIVEFLKGWLLYSALPYSLGIDWSYGGYLLRGDSLRALASSGQAIVMGYMMAVALGFYWYLAAGIKDTTKRNILAALLFAGLIAPVSRGPWVGVVCMLGVILALSPNPIKNILKVSSVGLVVALLLIVTPYGDKLIEYLPFVGSVDANNVDYRKSLLENSWQVIQRNLLFGSSDFMENQEMEDLRAGAGEGIIDLVNSYVAIALSGGLIGLGLFAGFFASCGWNVFKAQRNKFLDKASARLGQALFATLIGILVIIYTVSSILFIPVLYWLVGGMCVGYVGLVLNLVEKKARSKCE
jgi:hypothetical protein